MFFMMSSILVARQIGYIHWTARGCMIPPLLMVYLQAAAADALSKFYYPPVAAVSVSYPKEAIRKECLIDGELKGFGQLHPRSQGVETLGN